MQPCRLGYNTPFATSGTPRRLSCTDFCLLAGESLGPRAAGLDVDPMSVRGMTGPETLVTSRADIYGAFRPRISPSCLVNRYLPDTSWNGTTSFTWRALCSIPGK